jgi:transcriptional regulator GlxA family with amidase domain
MPTVKPLKIGLLAYPGCMPAGLFAAADLFQAINRRNGKAVFDPVWIGAAARIDSPAGPALELAHSLQEPCDAYLVPGFWAESAADIDAMLARQAALVAWLRQLPAHVALWSYCMGVALVAAAGRIDHRQATATWWLEHPLRQRFGAVGWNFQHTVLEDHGMITASGANGYWSVVSQVLLPRIAADVIRDVEQAMLVPRAFKGHPVFRSVELMAQPDAQMQSLISFAQRTPAAALNLAAAADFLAVSPRTLDRKIRQHSNVSAGECLRLVKLHQVANALLASKAPLKAIGADLGFTDEASLMRAFKKATGMTTSQYRQHFGGSVASFAAGVA